MKKLLVSLLLLSTTGAMVAGTLSLQNNLTKSRFAKEAPAIECIVTEDGTSKKVTIREGQTEKLGDISSIKQIIVGTSLTAHHPAGEYATYLPLGYATEKAKEYGVGVDNITNEFLAATKGHEGDDFLVTVEWKYPNSYTSREWKYSFMNQSRF